MQRWALALGLLSVSVGCELALDVLGGSAGAGPSLVDGGKRFAHNFELKPVPLLGKTASRNPANPRSKVKRQELFLGGLSGLRFVGRAHHGRELHFVATPDKGPGGERADTDSDGIGERPFPLPNYAARLVHLSLNRKASSLRVQGETFLLRKDGQTPITGRSNLPDERIDEEGVDLFGNPLEYDAFGGDFEGVELGPAGGYWLVDEYRPSIYHFQRDGVLIERYVPHGTADQVGMAPGTYGSETLPAVYLTRRRNRGFEAVAYDSDHDVIYALIQTPLQNPDRETSDSSLVIRMLGIDPHTGTPIAEHVYLLDPVLRFAKNVDKIGDAVYAGCSRFFVIERDSAVGVDANKRIYRIDIATATNLISEPPNLLPGKTLEQHTSEELRAIGVVPVSKIEVVNLPSVGYTTGDKPEGIALLADGTLAVINDNDFGGSVEPFVADGTIPLLDPRPPTVLGVLDRLGASLARCGRGNRGRGVK